MPGPFVTPNMGLTEPAVGSTPSPNWAALLNADMELIDQHDHSPGQGVPVTPGGININSDLSFNSHNLTSLNEAIFAGSVIGVPEALSIYTNGTDLFYKDVNGNPIQLTKAGGPNAGTGNIQNLPSTPLGGAGISWVNSQSTFQLLNDSGAVGANLDAGSLIVRFPGSYPTPSGNFIAIEAPSSLSSGYSLILPSLPSSQKIMTLDNAGNIAAPYTVDGSTITISSNVIGVPNSGIGTPQLANNAVTTAKIADGNVTRPKLVAVGQQVSGSSGLFNVSTSTFTDVTNLSVSLTTTGRPVLVFLQADNASADDASISLSSSFNQNAFIRLRLSKNFNGGGYVAFPSSYVFQQAIFTNFQQIPPGSFMFLDTSASAGTNQYKLQISLNGNVNPAVASINNCVLVAYEL